MANMRRRRLFALAGGASTASALPAVAAPIVEMHAADVTPVFVVGKAERYVSDFGTISIQPSDLNDLMRRMMAGLKADIKRQMDHG